MCLRAFENLCACMPAEPAFAALGEYHAITRYRDIGDQGVVELHLVIYSVFPRSLKVILSQSFPFAQPRLGQLGI